jgi:outer membrane protein OmpA-like peptidoglycan-associated protein
MSDDEITSGTAMAAQHTVFPRASLKVAPTDTTNFNAIRIPLIPVACWRLNDPGFAFDSSFVAPTFQGEIAQLAALVQANPGCPAALFGHADPAGSDDVNKTISDRRAIATYALLTRQPPLWEYLYSNPVDGDTWGTRAIQVILQMLTHPVFDADGNRVPPDASYYGGDIDGKYGPETQGAVKQFQSDAGLAVDGDAGPQTRKVLFGAYMDMLCTSPASNAPPASDPNGAPPSQPTETPFQMQPSDFLGGASAGPGDLPKMSLQGCSRFNPVVLLTTEEMDGDDQDTRNADDAPNRRVLMLLFPQGTKGDASFWPCPQVKDSADGCRAAFWSDGDSRRQSGDTRREYKTRRDTMACRFYDRFARRSPCEGKVPPTPPLLDDYPFSI